MSARTATRSALVRTVWAMSYPTLCSDRALAGELEGSGAHGVSFTLAQMSPGATLGPVAAAAAATELAYLPARRIVMELFDRLGPAGLVAALEVLVGRSGALDAALTTATLAHARTGAATLRVLPARALWSAGVVIDTEGRTAARVAQLMGPVGLVALRCVPEHPQLFGEHIDRLVGALAGAGAHSEMLTRIVIANGYCSTGEVARLAVELAGRPAVLVEALVALCEAAPQVPIRDHLRAAAAVCERARA